MPTEIVPDVYDVTVREDDTGRRYRAYLVDDDVPTLFDAGFADTTEALRVLETSHPPVYYLPPDDIATEHLEREQQTTMCEFKGRAVYYTLTVGDRSARSAAWGYPDPTARFAELQDYVTFYASKVDECYVGEEEARAQEGDFYGGWITDDVVGPFKGGPGTMGW